MGYWRRGTRGLDCWHARRYQKGLGCLDLKPCPWDVPCWRVIFVYSRSLRGRSFCFLPDSPDSLWDALLRAVQDEEARAPVIERGWVVASGYSWERCAEQTLALYRECL